MWSLGEERRTRTRARSLGEKEERTRMQVRSLGEAERTRRTEKIMIGIRLAGLACRPRTKGASAIAIGNGEGHGGDGVAQRREESWLATI